MPIFFIEISFVLIPQIVATLPIAMSVHSVFSNYSISPARGIHFGPVLSSTSKTRIIEISNNGSFDLTYSTAKVVDAMEEALTARGRITARDKGKTPRSAGKRKEEKTKTVEKKTDKQSRERLEIGPFLITPAIGTIPAGSKATINVDFRAFMVQEEGGIASTRVCFDLSDRRPGAEDNDVLDLIGEACVPGIETEDWRSVFEEQVVARRVDLVVPSRAVFATDERTFSFGAVLTTNRTTQRFRYGVGGIIASAI